MDDQPNNKSMSPYSLGKPNRSVPVYNLLSWSNRSKVINTTDVSSIAAGHSVSGGADSASIIDAGATASDLQVQTAIPGVRDGIIPGMDTVGVNVGICLGTEPVNGGTGNDSTDVAGAVPACMGSASHGFCPIIDISADTAHMGSASISVPNGPAKGIVINLGSEVFPPLPAKSASGKHKEAPQADRETCASHHASTIKAGANFSDFGKLSKAGRLKGSAPTSSNSATVEMVNDPPVKSWRNLISMPMKTDSPLQFYTPHCVDGKLVAKPPMEAVNGGIDIWKGCLATYPKKKKKKKGCLVGQFLDKRLPFPVVRSLVNRLWGKREMPGISTTQNGLFFFRFRDPEAREWVMNAGPWHLAGRPFILRAWKPGMDMLNIQLSSIPIWVRFFNIPLEYWTSTCLGHIASTVGIPLHLDPLTENHTKLSFARICIEVGVDCEFPKSVLLDRGNGSYSTIRIEYPWAPQCCSECKLFGHNLANCQAKKSPSSGMISTNPGNSKHETVIRKDFVDEGEGLKIAAESTNAVAIPTVKHAATTSSVPTITHAEAGIRLDVEDIRVASEVVVSPKLHGNTFACLAQSEEECPCMEEGPMPDPANTDFLDTSPIIDRFKQIKRVDELDFSPVPLSRKKLKKLKKRGPVTTQVPEVGGNPHLPNG